MSVATVVWALVSAPATTLEEGKVFASSKIQLANTKAAMAMRVPWREGFALMQNYGNEVSTFRSDIPLQNIIYEGNNNDNLWQKALSNPAAMDVRLIYMRRTPGNEDEVWQALHDSPILNQYHIVYQDSNQVVYGWGAVLPLIEKKQPKILATGEATWFIRTRGTCFTSVAPLGSIVTVTNEATSAQVTCRVTGSGPSDEGRVINLESHQFSQLADPAGGVVQVIVSTTP
jgi:hypothetical protein